MESFTNKVNNQKQDWLRAYANESVEDALVRFQRDGWDIAPGNYEYLPNARVFIVKGVAAERKRELLASIGGTP